MNKIVFLLLFLLTVPACAQWEEVDFNFNSADYSTTTAMLDSLGVNGQKGVDYLYWRIRLESDPEELVILFNESAKYFVNFPQFENFVKIEKSRLVLAKPGYSSEDSTENQTPFLSAILHYLNGDYDTADELFSSISKSNPEFSWALYYKAMIALRRGERSKAEQILDNIDKIYNDPSFLWALYHVTKLSDPNKSLKTAEFILSEYPTSLACLAINTNTNLPDIPDTLQPLEEAINIQTDGRFSIQFAAFYDRSNAITFISSWHDMIPGLEIESFNSDTGAMIYKLRLGSWKTRPDAESACEFYQNKFELESIVVDTADEL